MGRINNRDPGKRLDINMYTEGHTVKGARKTALEPPRCAPPARQEQGCARAVRRQLRRPGIRMKTEEWNSFTKHLTEWERQNTLIADRSRNRDIRTIGRRQLRRFLSERHYAAARYPAPGSSLNRAGTADQHHSLIFDPATPIISSPSSSSERLQSKRPSLNTGKW